MVANRRNALLNGGKSAAYSANTIMDFWWTVNRDDDVIEYVRNALRLFEEEEPGCEKGNSDFQITEEVADPIQFAIQQWFTASQHYVFYAELLNGFTMSLEVGSTE